jgi:hypothetical protein
MPTMDPNFPIGTRVKLSHEWLRQYSGHPSQRKLPQAEWRGTVIHNPRDEHDMPRVRWDHHSKAYTHVYHPKFIEIIK